MVEGPKAGGHLGFKKEQIQDQHYALEALIPEVVMIASSYKEQKQIPVIAAGGISTGEDIAHFMELGASGVQMGSIFVMLAGINVKFALCFAAFIVLSVCLVLLEYYSLHQRQ